MSLICPTVLADTVDEYRDQMEAIRPFASRIQIDLGDGDFTSETVGVTDVWWPEHIVADIHLMYRHPLRAVSDLVALKPAMVIIHAESEKAAGALALLREQGIRTGVALLQGTSVESAMDSIRLCDHVLIFSGSLGSFGGQVDLSLLSKVQQIRAINPAIEIGWDGGINADTARKLADGGIDVLNVGGAIQKASHPENAYRDLLRRLQD
jgi:ribulose-phosphate 3-epimerase